jgi:hypothetical protein
VIPSATTNHRLASAASALLIFIGASACAGPGASMEQSASTGPTGSTEASTTPASVSPSSSGPVGERYTTTSFAVPLTVSVEPMLSSPPTSDTTNLLSWDAAANGNEKIRFLIPVEVYRPGSSTPQRPPADYLAYLQGQAAQGGQFADISTITVDGHAGTLMTATTTRSLSGSIGCPVVGADQGEGCYGLQPDLILRIAVIDLGGGTTLVAWARTGSEAPNDEFNAMFERMLANLKFTFN